MDTHNCHADGVCINTDGSFRCECQMGYSGNGVLCSGRNRVCMYTIENQGTLIETLSPGHGTRQFHLRYL